MRVVQVVNVSIRLSELKQSTLLGCISCSIERGAFSSDTTRATGEMASL